MENKKPAGTAIELAWDTSGFLAQAGVGDSLCCFLINASIECMSILIPPFEDDEGLTLELDLISYFLWERIPESAGS